MTAGTARMINSELASQTSRKLNEKKLHLKSQILQAIDSAIAEKVLAELQNSLGMLEKGLNGKMDLRSTALHRNHEVGTKRKTLENRSKTDFNQSNSACIRKEYS